MGIIKYTDEKNVDLLGVVIDKTKVYARPYSDLRQLNELLELAKKQKIVILNY